MRITRLSGRGMISLSAVCLIAASPALSRQLVVGVPRDGDAAEEAYLRNTLDNLGFALRLTNDPASSDCRVYVTHPGQGGGESGPADILSWVQAGHGVVQIGNWGPDLIPNESEAVGEGSTQTVALVEDHQITAGRPDEWTTRGYWVYGDAQDRVGWATTGPSLVRIGVRERALSVAESGGGRLVYIGWNVHRPTASFHDVALLEQAILWAAGISYARVGINFQPLAAEVPAGHVADNGTAYADRDGYEYGWR